MPVTFKKFAVATVRTIAGFAAVLIVVWLFIVIALTVLSHTYRYGDFHSGDSTLRIAAGTGVMDEGFIDIENSRTDVSIILEPGEWDRLMSFWDSARHVHAVQWQTIGEIKETDTYDNTVITVRAGPGIRFAIRENGACADYALEPNDIVPLDTALRHAARRLHGVAANGDEQAIPLDLRQRLTTGWTTFTSGPRSFPAAVDSCSH
ncbi:MAG: hypothetical protein WCA81_17220 [Rhizomicrobium sp.]